MLWTDMWIMAKTLEKGIFELVVFFNVLGLKRFCNSYGNVHLDKNTSLSYDTVKCSIWPVHLCLFTAAYASTKMNHQLIYVSSDSMLLLEDISTREILGMCDFLFLETCKDSCVNVDSMIEEGIFEDLDFHFSELGQSVYSVEGKLGSNFGTKNLKQGLWTEDLKQYVTHHLTLEHKTGKIWVPFQTLRRGKFVSHSILKGKNTTSKFSYTFIYNLLNQEMKQSKSFSSVWKRKCPWW